MASANALLTKDYTDLPPYSVIGGCPAKLLKTGVRRVYNTEKERVLNNFFNSENTNFVIEETIDLEEFCAVTTRTF